MILRILNKEQCLKIKEEFVFVVFYKCVCRTDVGARLNNKKVQLGFPAQGSSGVYIGPWGLLKITLKMTECSKNKYKSLRIVLK